jgi:hypothetical protein
MPELPAPLHSFAPATPVRGPHAEATGVDQSRRSHLPDKMLLRIIIVRALGIWIGVRLTAAVGAAFAFGATGLAMFRQSLPGAVLMVAVSGTLSVIDLRRRREEVMLANLEVGTSTYLLVGLVPMLIAEFVLRVATGR